jgi:hypothetical protein
MVLWEDKDGKPRNDWTHARRSGLSNSSCPTRCPFTLKYLNSCSRPSTSGASRKVNEKGNGASNIHSGQSSKSTSKTACLIKQHAPPNKRQSPDRNVKTRSESPLLLFVNIKVIQIFNRHSYVFWQSVIQARDISLDTSNVRKWPTGTG